jgi:phosphoribosyl 1,2-cyclic phosphate phosphodiesterase
MKVTFLGTGTSHGIPVPTCHCPVCMSSDPRDKRYRSSLLLEQDGKVLIIDTGPEFRLQALRAGFDHIDAVLYTHSHADHINGIDDLRIFCKEKPLPVYADSDVVSFIEDKFGYALRDTSKENGGLPHLSPEVLQPYVEKEIFGFPVTPIPVQHGRHTIYAYRIGNLVYSTDTSGIDDTSLSFMKGADTLIIGALRYKSHPTHFSVDQAIEISKKIGARQTYFTHMCHDLSHQTLCDTLPPEIRPAYDTFSFEV